MLCPPQKTHYSKVNSSINKNYRFLFISSSTRYLPSLEESKQNGICPFSAEAAQLPMDTQETSNTPEPTRFTVQLQADLPQCGHVVPDTSNSSCSWAALNLVALNYCTWQPHQSKQPGKSCSLYWVRQRYFSWLHQLCSSQPLFLSFPQAREQMWAQLMATICRLREEFPNSSNPGADKPAL